MKLRLSNETLFFTPLSGGIDSTILVNFIGKFVKNFKTFFAVSHSAQQNFKSENLNNTSEAFLVHTYQINSKLNMI